MKVKHSGTVERNIYVEGRSGSLRFTVEVSPFPKDHLTVDLDQYDKGLNWARRRRVELLEQKSSRKPEQPPSGPVIEPGWHPSSICISDVLENYRIRELPKLAGAASDKSRLKRLEEWFGCYTLGQLSYDVLETWKDERQAGKLGSGRVSDPTLTKQQRYKLRRAGQPLPPTVIKPVASQTVRHELVLFRRALTAYFRAHSLMHLHGAWLASQHIMDMPLPEKSDAREVRVDDDGLAALVRELDDPQLQAFVRLAVMTTLRRSEVCSLRWEDVDFDKKIMGLRAPGHRKKTKTHGRQIPLLPPAIAILRKLGPKESGKIFQITPSGISQALRRCADRAGLTDLRLHDLRREGISRLVELLQVPLATVTVFSGHSDQAVLQKHYLKQRSTIIAEQLTAHPGAATMIASA